MYHFFRKKELWAKKKYFLFSFIIMGFVFWVLGSLTVRAEERVIKVGYSDSNPIFEDEQGNYSGYGVAYLEEIAKYTGWEYEYIGDTWENCMSRLEKGELDLLIMAHYDSDRQKRFLFSELSMGYDYPILYTTSESEIFYQDYQSFEGCRIGVSADTSFENILKEYLKELNLNCKLVSFSTEQKAKEAMLRGDIEIMVSSVCVPQTDVKMIDRFGAAPGYIITGLQNKILMDEINRVMQKIRIYTPNLEEILMRTYYNASMDITNLYLTRQEQQYIDSVGPILIKCFDNHKPFCYIDENGKFQGILADYLNHLGKLSGLEFVYEATEYSKFDVVLSDMQDDNFGIFLAGNTETGLENSLYSTNSLFETSLAYIRKKDDYVSKYGKHVFAVSSDVSYVKDLLLSTNAESEVLFFDNGKECMEAVLQGKAEMAILSDRIAEYWLQKPVYHNKLTRIAGSGAYVYEIRLYVPEEHKELVSILNKTLEHISETERRYLLDNFSLSHNYRQSPEDMIYEHKDEIVVFSVLATIILGLAVHFIRFRIKFKDKEALQLKDQIERTKKIFQIVSEHSNRTLYAYDLESKTTKPWDEESEKKDILGHIYAKQYSAENLEQNEGIFDEQKDMVKAFFEDIHGGVPTGEMNLRIRLQDKEVRWFHFKYSSIFHQEKPVSAVISVVDITEQHEHEMAYLRMKQATESNANAAESLVSLEIDLTMDRVEKLSGIKQIEFESEDQYTISKLMEEILSKNIFFIKEKAAKEYFSTKYFLRAYARGERQQRTEWQVRFPNGSEHWLDTEITLMKDPYSNDVKLFIWMHDITEEKNQRLEIRERSEKDGMTGVYNRSTTEELIRKKLGRINKGIFLIIDLDGLKQINDHYGHRAGDEAIIGLANVLKSHFRGSDIIGRLGGDEFVVYLPGAARNKEMMTESFNRILKKLNALSIGEEQKIKITCSMGCVVEKKNATYESLYEQADKALYHIKGSGKNNFKFYSLEMEK